MSTLKNKKTPQILVLSDARAGNEKQSIALAEATRLKYTMIRLSFNLLGALPNWMKSGLIDINRSQREKLLKTDAKIVISSGRRAARVAKVLKEHNTKLKWVQILKPETSLELIDLLILPKHDAPPTISKDRLELVIGALVQPFEYDKLTINRSAQAKIDVLSGAKLGVLIGGNSKSAHFSKAAFNRFTDLLIKKAASSKASLMISTSRRTPIEFIKELEEKLLDAKIQYYLYIFKQNSRQNAYETIIANADFLITTADSISMCTELINTQKPVFIYSDGIILSSKHRAYLKSAISNRYAKNLNTACKIAKFPIKKLDGCENIARRINKWIEEKS